MVAEWIISSDNERRQRYVDKLGQAEYDRRQQVVNEKLATFPDNEWENRVILGGQFEPLAMQCSPELFEKIASRDYRFWCRMVVKLAGVG